MTLPTINMTATGNNITHLKKKAGLTVKNIQAVMGLNNPQAIYAWQRGQALPTVDNLVVLAAILNVKIDDIIVRTN